MNSNNIKVPSPRQVVGGTHYPKLFAFDEFGYFEPLYDIF